MQKFNFEEFTFFCKRQIKNVSLRIFLCLDTPFLLLVRKMPPQFSSRLTSSRHAAERLMQRFGGPKTREAAGLSNIRYGDITSAKKAVIRLCSLAIENGPQTLHPTIREFLNVYDEEKVMLTIGDSVAIFVVSKDGNVITVMNQSELKSIYSAITAGIMKGQDLKSPNGPHDRYNPETGVQRQSEGSLLRILNSLDRVPYGFLLYRIAAVLNDRLIQIVIDHMTSRLSRREIAEEVKAVDVNAGGANALHKAVRAAKWLFERPDIHKDSPIVMSFLRTLHLLTDIGVPMWAKDKHYDRTNTRRYDHEDVSQKVFKGGFTPMSYFHFNLPLYIRERLCEMSDRYPAYLSRVAESFFSEDYW